MFCFIFWLLSQELVRALMLSLQHTAATAKAVMFLTFDRDVFIFTYLDTEQLCRKL